MVGGYSRITPPISGFNDKIYTNFKNYCYNYEVDLGVGARKRIAFTVAFLIENGITICLFILRGAIAARDTCPGAKEEQGGARKKNKNCLLTNMGCSQSQPMRKGLQKKNFGALPP